MRIRVGCEMTYQFGQATPMVVMLNVHASRVSDLELPDDDQIADEDRQSRRLHE